MKRQAIKGGCWFDRDAAKCYEEGHHFDGQNYISDATGSQWEHEELYRTRGGRWVLCVWSQWQRRSRPTWQQISDHEAATWLVANGHEPHPSCAAEFAEHEV